MLAFDDERMEKLVDRAGFSLDTMTVAVTEQTMADVAAVDGYLSRRPHPGAPTPVEMVTGALGPEVARRFVGAWRDAVRTQGTITWTTPVLYLTATRRM
jgi:hypothetical protein